MRGLSHLPLLLISLIASFPYASLSQSQLPLYPSFLNPDAKPLPHPVEHLLEHEPVRAAPECPCNLSGPIEATQCDYETVESVTEDLFERLDALVKTPFFKYYKVDLYRDCPFWQENSFCMNRRCGVETLDESEIPEAYRAETLSKVRYPSAEQATHFEGCYYRNSDYCFLDDDDSKDSLYIDLTLNPEGFTGYAGDSAHRVWSSIYDENCFGVTELSGGEEEPQQDGHCLEKRVYYRVISGLHASISTHICHAYLDQKTGEWRPNLACYIRRIASHPERLQHVYFNTVLLLRALTRIGPHLAAYDMGTGDAFEDLHARDTLASLIDVARGVGRFDERALFSGENKNVLKEEFKAHFRNVSRVMDCVGCDKCRLWGKVQTQGIGTALKILFELDEKALDPLTNPGLLKRSELVALLNTLHRFVESLHITSEFRQLWADTAEKGNVMRRVGAGDVDVPMEQEQEQFMAHQEEDEDEEDEEEETEEEAMTPRIPTKPSPSLRPDVSSLPESIYTRLASLVQACSTRSYSACADLMRLVVDVAGKVASALSMGSKEHGPGAGGEL